LRHRRVVTWNKSIARLGLQPVFPPSEDIFVGDVWAVVVEDALDSSLPLLGKAVRVDHIDFRKDILAEAKGRPVFEDTADLKKDEAFRRQGRKETTPDTGESIALALAAFPGITISYATQSAGTVGSSWGSLGGGKRSQQTEEIRIPIAETYGVSARVGYIGFDKWCKTPETKTRCTDQFVRNLFAFTIDNRVLEKREDGQYGTRLQLSLVTRVFLAREIEQRRQIHDDRGLLVQIPIRTGKAGDSSPTEATTVAASSQPPPATPLDAADHMVAAAAAGTKAGSKFSILSADGVEVGIREVFQRPVAFGFRTVNFTLEPTPSPKEPAK
jgi:hypothetical protein